MKTKPSNLSDKQFNELDDKGKLNAYKAIMQSRNEYRNVGKFAARLNDVVTWLSTSAAVAFEAMAEKAGVSSHEDVQTFVKAFGECCYSQWSDGGKLPKIQLPYSFDIDEDLEKYSGDAGMKHSAKISELMNYLKSLYWDKNKELSNNSIQWRAALFDLTDGIVSGLKSKRSAPHEMEMPLLKDHCEHCRDMSWMALDLAEDMTTTMEMLRGDLRAASYRRISRDLYKLSCPPDNIQDARKSKFQVKVIGEPSF